MPVADTGRRTSSGEAASWSHFTTLGSASLKLSCGVGAALGAVTVWANGEGHELGLAAGVTDATGIGGDGAGAEGCRFSSSGVGVGAGLAVAGVPAKGENPGLWPAGSVADAIGIVEDAALGEGCSSLTAAGGADPGAALISSLGNASAAASGCAEDEGLRLGLPLKVEGTTGIGAGAGAADDEDRGWETWVCGGVTATVVAGFSIPGRSRNGPTKTAIAAITAATVRTTVALTKRPRVGATLSVDIRVGDTGDAKFGCACSLVDCAASSVAFGLAACRT